jgi:hypothetical protein
MIITILHTTTGVVGLNFQLAATQVYNFQLDFQPAKKGKLKTWLKNMLWLNFWPFIRNCEFCTTRSVCINTRKFQMLFLECDDVVP